MKVTNRKRTSRGWLPKEPTLSTCQSPANSTISVFTRWMAIAIIAGTIGGALLGVVGALFGLTEGIGIYAWPIATAIIVGVCIGLFAVYMRRKLELQTR